MGAWLAVGSLGERPGPRNRRGRKAEEKAGNSQGSGLQGVAAPLISSTEAMEPDQQPGAAAGPEEPAAGQAEAAAPPPPQQASGAPDDAEGAAGLGDSQEEGSEEEEETEGYGSEEEDGPDSLLLISQRQVLKSIHEASTNMGAAFCVGGSLGRLPISLAVAPPLPGAAGETEAGTPGASGSSTSSRARQAVVVTFPDGGQADVEALQEACVPATFGRGTEEGGRQLGWARTPGTGPARLPACPAAKLPSLRCSFPTSFALPATMPSPSAVLDESYRQALAVPASRLFTQLDLAAHGGVLEAVRRLLLPDAALLTAQLHTLNVYGPGGFFRGHRDTPRGNPRFVGSLVLCLPVAHMGGGLRVRHGGRSVVYEWGAGAAAGEVQWAAFFSDCLHEVLPVESGARVTLSWELFAHPGGWQPLVCPAAAA